MTARSAQIDLEVMSLSKDIQVCRDNISRLSEENEATVSREDELKLEIKALKTQTRKSEKR